MLAGLAEKQRELVAADAEGPVLGAHELLEQGAELLEHPVTDHVPVTVVDLLEVVEVEEHEGESAILRTFARVLQFAQERAPVQQAREGIVVGEEAGLGELGRDGQRLHRVVREHPQRLEPLVRREHAVARLVGPDDTDDRTLLVAERDDQPVVVPGSRPASVANRLVDDLAAADPALGLIARDEVAAGDLEARLEEP